MIVVVDASVVISWIADERNSYADAVRDAIGTDEAHVPGIWHWEVSNTLMVLERKGRIRDASDTYAQVRQLPIAIELLAYKRDVRSSLELELARSHELSVYDAAYLAQAKALSLSLATLDRRLADAARRERLFFTPPGM